jgi:CubicO group peptidase (beta-lactamase class C family)
MKFTKPITSLMLLFISQFSVAEQANIVSQKIDKHIQKYVEEEDFRGVVLVAKEGKILFNSAYGNADDSNNTVNTIDKKFMIGSLTKSFTAVAVMKLVDEGKLDLNAPLATYIPKLKSKISKDLTLHLLLKHQSGLPQHLDRIVSFEDKDISSDEILAIINTTKLSFLPSSQYQYSNLNYHLAAIAIENVMGKTYAEVLHEKIFLPLKMKESGIERLTNVPTNKANGYRKSILGINRDENIVSYALGSGDIYSTVKDLLIWEQSLYGIKLLTKKSTKILFSGENKEFGHYGYGFRIQEYQRAKYNNNNKGTLTRHGGSMNGFLSNLHRYTDDKLTVIVLANIRSFPIRKLTFEIKEIVLGFNVGDRNRENFE